jgi:hypothetical protein
MMDIAVVMVDVSMVNANVTLIGKEKLALFNNVIHLEIIDMNKENVMDMVYVEITPAIAILLGEVKIVTLNKIQLDVLLIVMERVSVKMENVYVLKAIKLHIVKKKLSRLMNQLLHDFN